MGQPHAPCTFPTRSYLHPRAANPEAFPEHFLASRRRNPQERGYFPPRKDGFRRIRGPARCGGGSVRARALRPAPAAPRTRDTFTGSRAPYRAPAVRPVPHTGDPARARFLRLRPHSVPHPGRVPYPRFECLFSDGKLPVSGGKWIFKFASPFHLDFTGIRRIPPEIPFPGRAGKQSQTRNVIPGAYRTSQRLGVRSNCALKVLLTTTYGTLQTTGWSTQGDLPLSPRGPTT